MHVKVMTPRLEAKIVSEIFSLCLLDDSMRRLSVQGVSLHAGLSVRALEVFEDLIGELLEQLPEQFRTEQGDSLANAGMNYMGEPWSDKFTHPEQLMLLGFAAGLVEYTFPRERWVKLTGGLPYFRVLADKINHDNDDS